MPTASPVSNLAGLQLCLTRTADKAGEVAANVEELADKVVD